MPHKTRRDFLRTVAGAGAASVAVAPQVTAADPVVLAVIGTNSRGSALARGFARLPGVEIAYICDVDEAAAAKGIKAVTDASGQVPKGERDFRRALADPRVDALVIATPDHWHAPATILACQAGKHVYVEKPCSHNPREGELMVEAARKYRRLVQIGTQRRSHPLMREAIQQLRSGVIGRVYYSRSGLTTRRPSIGRGKPAAIPAGLDYDLWQGPAPRRPYQDNLIHYNWHFFWHWGTGETGNRAIHNVDLSRWGLEADYPTLVSAGGGRYHFSDDQETPDTLVMTMEFEDGRSAMWEGLSSTGMGTAFPGVVSFHGEGGSLVYYDGRYQAFDVDGKMFLEVEHSDKSAGEVFHFTNFLEAIRGRAELNAEIEEGHKSTLLCHLANMSARLNRSLECDPANGHVRLAGEPAPQECRVTYRPPMDILFSCDPPRPEIADQVEALWTREYQPGWEPIV